MFEVGKRYKLNDTDFVEAGTLNKAIIDIVGSEFIIREADNYFVRQVETLDGTVFSAREIHPSLGVILTCDELCYFTEVWSDNPALDSAIAAVEATLAYLKSQRK